MSIKKIIITKGIYSDRELRLLVSFDENDCPVDIINLDITKVGEIHLASVEKVLHDIGACILKLDSDDKAFIENKKLMPEYYVVSHSDKKLVCQGDKFYVQISQDRKGVKPYSCNFIESDSEDVCKMSFINYYLDKYCDDQVEIISDLEDIAAFGIEYRFYSDEDISLWKLYGLTKILDNISSKICHLKSGGNIVIEPTEALTVIDVNSGKNYGKQTFMQVNYEAIETAFKEIRLRSLSGIILIDLLKMSKAEEDEILAAAKSLAKDDISCVNIHGFSNLGLLEITRSRIFSPFII